MCSRAQVEREYQQDKFKIPKAIPQALARMKMGKHAQLSNQWLTIHA